MKRRLTKAYDIMTMPDHCSNTIERKLLEGMAQKQVGNYSKTMKPTRIRHYEWLRAAAAVCLVLLLSVGGTMLFLDSSADKPVETVEGIGEQETTSVTPKNHYELVTDLPPEQVEAFAKVIRYNMLEMNWEALEDRICFPLSVQNEEIQNWQEFLDWINGFSLYSSSWKRLEEESCQAMFCNWQGICMADGFIWFNEVDGALKITAINMAEQEEPVETDVPDVFADVLKENKAFFCERTKDDVTITEYCKLRSKEIGKTVTAPYFTVVDMDRDGIKELVLKISIEGDPREDYLILRWQGYPESDESFVYAYMEGLQKMTDLRKDGSFWWREAGPGQGESRLMLDPKNGSGIVLSGFSVQGESPEVLWHTWPCVRPEVVIQSYEYAGTGQSRMPSTTYYTFEGLAMGTTANDWSQLKENLIRMGMVCLEDEGTVSMFDPDAPGTCLYGTLTNEKGLVQLADVGYYISNEYGEREAEVRDLLSEDPQYIAGSHLEELDAHGREVERLEILLEYLS